MEWPWLALILLPSSDFVYPGSALTGFGHIAAQYIATVDQHTMGTLKGALPIPNYFQLGGTGFGGDNHFVKAEPDHFASISSKAQKKA